MTEPMAHSADNGEHRRVRNPDSIDTCTGCGWEGWDTAPTFAEHLPDAENGLPTRAWWKVRGEAVGVVGLLGDIMQDWGTALGQWSNRHMFTPRELEQLTRVTPPATSEETR